MHNSVYMVFHITPLCMKVVSKNLGRLLSLLGMLYGFYITYRTFRHSILVWLSTAILLNDTTTSLIHQVKKKSKFRPQDVTCPFFSSLEG